MKKETRRHPERSIKEAAQRLAEILVALLDEDAMTNKKAGGDYKLKNKL